MADAIVLAPDCYVYILFREDGITPFYVGKGRNDRWLDHERSAKHGRSHKDNIIHKMRSAGIPIRKEKVSEGLTDEEACRIEIELIASIGRRHEGGPLVNITAGGEGMLRPTPEHREKLRAAHIGKTLPEEQKRKISLANRGKTRSASAIEKTRQSRIGVPHSQETKERIAVALKGRKNGPPSDETRANISAGLKGKRRGRQSADVQEKRSRSLKESWAAVPKEERAKRGMAGKSHSEETKAKMREKALGRVISESQRAAISAVQTGRKQSAETIAKRSESIRKAWEAKRAKEAVLKDGEL